MPNINDFREGSYALPVRVQYGPHPVGPGLSRGPAIVIAGSDFAWGDAGWTVIRCRTSAERRQIAGAYPEARTPAWNRLGL